MCPKVAGLPKVWFIGYRLERKIQETWPLYCAGAKARIMDLHCPGAGPPGKSRPRMGDSIDLSLSALSLLLAYQ
jgi:hypothetical protein